MTIRDRQAMFHIYGGEPGGAWTHIASASNALGAVRHYGDALKRFPSVVARDAAGAPVDLPSLMDRASSESMANEGSD
jgi:hypothetical protein